MEREIESWSSRAVPATFHMYVETALLRMEAGGGMDGGQASRRQENAAGVDGRPVWESVAHLAPAVQRLVVARPQGVVSTAKRRATLDLGNKGGLNSGWATTNKQFIEKIKYTSNAFYGII